MTDINRPENSLPYHIRGAFRGFETALSRYLKSVNLPLSQFYILRLEWTGAGAQQNEISEKACMSESVASQVIQKMEKAGLLQRKDDKKDGRKRQVYITPKGQSLRDAILNEGIQISKENSPNISREDLLTTISVLIEVKRAFDVFNSLEAED